MMALVPIVSACTIGWSNRPDRILPCSIQDPSARSGSSDVSDGPARPVTSSGAVVLSVEPAVTVPGTEAEAPVIFPGYVLPDDSREGSLHEGS